MLGDHEGSLGVACARLNCDPVVSKASAEYGREEVCGQPSGLHPVICRKESNGQGGKAGEGGGAGTVQLEGAASVELNLQSNSTARKDQHILCVGPIVRAARSST